MAGGARLTGEGAPPPSPVARLFIALWPPPDLAQRLHARYLQLRNAAMAGARAESSERLHLTLHFLGDVPRALLPELCRVLCVPFSALALELRVLERWPRGLVVAQPEPERALMALQAALAERLRTLGLRTEPRAFRPHLTLARRDTAPWPLAGARPALLPLPEPLHWPAAHYALVETLPGAPGPYRILHTCMAQPDSPDQAAAGPSSSHSPVACSAGCGPRPAGAAR